MSNKSTNRRARKRPCTDNGFIPKKGQYINEAAAFNCLVEFIAEDPEFALQYFRTFCVTDTLAINRKMLVGLKLLDAIQDIRGRCVQRRKAVS